MNTGVAAEMCKLGEKNPCEDMEGKSYDFFFHGGEEFTFSVMFRVATNSRSPLARPSFAYRRKMAAQAGKLVSTPKLTV